MPKKNDRALKKLEKDIVEQNKSGKTEADFEDDERKVIEDIRQNREGLGIEKEEDAGQEPYPEVEKALKDPEEEDEEE